MPLPKGIKTALDAWKAGTGEFPTDLEDGVFFPNTGAFDAEVRRKSKGVESQARESAMAKFLAEAGLTDETQIAEFRETVEKSGVLKTEADKSKTQLAKLAKDLEESRKETETFKGTVATLTDKIKGTAKRDAISKFASQVVDHEALAMFVAPHLEIADDGTVSIKGADGKPDAKKTLDQLVEETLKAKPYLKNPDFKPGPGTTPTPSTKTDKAAVFTPEKDKDGKDKPLTFAQAAINGLASAGYKFDVPSVGP